MIPFTLYPFSLLSDHGGGAERAVRASRPIPG